MTKIDKIIKYYFNFAANTLIIFLLPFYTIAASTNNNCLSQAISDLEHVYCEVVSRGEGKSLPRFEDFKQNDVLVQTLLLKRPAAKLKIKLPKQNNINYKPHKKTVIAANISKTKKPKVTTVSSYSVPTASIAPIFSSSSLEQCRLTSDKILCGNNHFLMKTNQPNKQLAAGVLEKSYTMNLPVYSGNEYDDLEIQYYLSEAYTVYIRKMVDIGMGASTMSYTRFFHTYYDLQTKNVSFTERFETMYSFLKKDKKTMAINSVLSDKRPDNISQCEDINEQIIACDSGGFNWIYVN